MHALTRIETSIASAHLQRQVRLSILLPPGYYREEQHYPLLYFHDGQDFTALDLEATMLRLITAGEIPPFLCVGIHAPRDRHMVYGTAKQPDFAGRGAKAALHSAFVREELRSYLMRSYRIREEAEHQYVAGCSLGGLAAMDLVWHHPDCFSRVGVFSGSFWWRSRDLGQGSVEETDRIMHALVRQGSYKPGLKFWFEAGTEDETSDRNQNGIIDAIEDTQDLIWELWKKGYQPERDLRYFEVEGGRHNQETWGQAMPHFLTWLFEHAPKP